MTRFVFAVDVQPYVRDYNDLLTVFFQDEKPPLRSVVDCAIRNLLMENVGLTPALVRYSLADDPLLLFERRSQLMRAVECLVEELQKTVFTIMSDNGLPLQVGQAVTKPVVLGWPTPTLVSFAVSVAPIPDYLGTGRLQGINKALLLDQLVLAEAARLPTSPIPYNDPGELY